MQTCVTGLDAPLTVQGRCPQVKSRFVAVAMTDADSDGQITVRIDDRLNPAFWAEVTIKPRQLLALIRHKGNVHASDFRYDD